MHPLLYNSRENPLVSSIAVNHMEGVPTCVRFPLLTAASLQFLLQSWDVVPFGNTRAHDGTAYAPTG